MGKAERKALAHTRKLSGASIWNSNSISTCRWDKLPYCTQKSSCNLWSNRTNMCQPGFSLLPLTYRSSPFFLFLFFNLVNFFLPSFQWLPEVPVLIFQATFSSDGRTVYSIFGDGTVAIFNASNFQLCSRIHPSSYLTPIARYILEFNFNTW